MMGRLKSDQGQLFYEFHLGDAVPEDHLVRKIDAALDLSWLRGELAPYCSSMGRPSIDPELMIRMLVVGYVFAIRSERLICREVQVNLAYRWFCKLGLDDAIPDRSAQRSRILSTFDLIRPATSTTVRAESGSGQVAPCTRARRFYIARASSTAMYATQTAVLPARVTDRSATPTRALCLT
jgi:transposase